jgi:hypothetical protein
MKSGSGDEAGDESIKGVGEEAGEEHGENGLVVVNMGERRNLKERTATQDYRCKRSRDSDASYLLGRDIWKLAMAYPQNTHTNQ